MHRLAKILAGESRGLDLAGKALCLLLLVFVGRGAAVLTWQGVDTFAPLAKGRHIKPLSPLTASPARLEAAVPPPVLYLFGVPAKTGSSDLTTTRFVPKTTLKLILKGIVAANPMARALAIVAEKKANSADKVYAIGDMLPGNARVVKIYADKIILERAGRHETLYMHEDGEIAKSGGRGGTIRSAGDGIHWQINNDYWQKRLADIPSLAREIGVDIYKEGNVQRGYRLVSARGSKLLRDLGLAPGDVLHEVNGVKLTNVHQGLAAYQKIRNASEIRLVVSRNGKRQTRVYNIEK